MITAAELLALWPDPHRTAARARARRAALGHDTIRIDAAPAHAVPQHAAIVRGTDVEVLPAWPAATALARGDRLVVQVDADADARARYAEWLVAFVRDVPPPCTVAPCSRTPAGLHPLWCIAATRIALPGDVVEARHDLLGIRLAQIALGFGADALTGPIAPDRSLPLCGVPRPDEHTLAGLAALVRHVGLSVLPPATARSA
jgi:hypothetical protein